MEMWLDIKGYEGLYQISNLGRVKSLSRIITYFRNGLMISRNEKEKILKQRINRYGYKTVNLNKKSKSKTFQIHVLVADNFLIREQANLVVNHIDGNKKNNKLINLELVTQSQNVEHAITTGLMESAFSNNGKKLNYETAEKLRVLYLEGDVTQKELAEMFKVSVRSISNVINRHSYA